MDTHTGSYGRRQTQTDGQAQTKTGRMASRRKDRQQIQPHADTHTNQIHIYTEILSQQVSPTPNRETQTQHSHIDKHTEKHTAKKTDRETARQTYREADRNTWKPTDAYADSNRQTQTDTHNHRQT